MKCGSVPADLLDSESQSEQKSGSSENEQSQILLFRHRERDRKYNALSSSCLALNCFAAEISAPTQTEQLL